ncbi:MAG: hypothetical protein U0174_03610 [Polyangiaceae bacterium]
MKNVAALFVVSLVGSLVACGGSTVVDNADDKRSPLGSVEPGCGDAEAILPADATKLTFRTPLFGVATTAPAGSECDRSYHTFVVDLVAREMTYEDCENVASDLPFMISRGWSVLNKAQVQAAKDAFAKLAHANGGACDASVARNEVSITTPRGITTYYDARSCAAQSPKVTGVDTLTDDLYGLLALR